LSAAPVLVIGIGNPSRGDDALGPLCIEGLAALDLPGVDLPTAFQLQVEYALDLRERRQVIFVDAAARGPEPYAFVPAIPAEDASYTSHELSPGAVLHAYRRLYGEPPEAWVLGIRGYGFGLGEGVSPQAASNLEAAEGFLAGHLAAMAPRPDGIPRP